MKRRRNFDTKRNGEVSGTAILNSNKNATSDSKVNYQCPMKCRGEEVYEEPGLCPDCNMPLVQVYKNNSHDPEHKHDCCKNIHV